LLQINMFVALFAAETTDYAGSFTAGDLEVEYVISGTDVTFTVSASNVETWVAIAVSPNGQMSGGAVCLCCCWRGVLCWVCVRYVGVGGLCFVVCFAVCFA
jgi:hypothetical protein